jgi:hypothetical protein
MHQELWDVLHGLLAMIRRGQHSVRLMVNSRIDLGGRLHGAPHIRLGALPDADAEQLLLLRAGEHVQWEEGQALQLVEMCGNNALALTVVGGLLAARSTNPEVSGNDLP